MDIIIRLKGETSEEYSSELNRLAHLFEKDYDLPVIRQLKNSDAGVKDGGLTFALTVVGLGLSAVSTVISALSYLKSTQPQCSITISRGDSTVTYDNLSEEQMKNILSETTTEQAAPKLTIILDAQDEA